MIGVVPQSRQIAVAEEFFELFKTPWELYCSDRSYDVVIVTSDEMPNVRAKLVIVCGHGAKDVDARFGIIADRVQRGTVVNHEDASLPIYNELLTFGNLGSGTACLGAGDANIRIRIDWLNRA